MKTVSKKLLSVLLVAILLVSAIPFQAFANGDLSDPAAAEPVNPVDPGTSAVVSDVPAGSGDQASADNQASADAGNQTLDTPAAPAATTAPETTATTAPETTATTAAAPQPEAHSGIGTHVPTGFMYNATHHWQECPNENCVLNQGGQKTPINGLIPHHYVNGVCECGASWDNCPHTTTQTQVNTGKAATCLEDGLKDKEVCSLCGKELPQEVIPATGHDFDPATGKCKNCAAVQYDGQEVNLTLDANGGTINGAAAIQIKVKKGQAVAYTENPTRPGFTFVCWNTQQDGTGVNVNRNEIYDGTYAALYAKWSTDTYMLTVRRVKNGNLSDPKTILEEAVPAGTPLLEYLMNNVYAAVDRELKLTPGFTWQPDFWRDYSGRQQSITQSDCMNQSQVVYVNFVSTQYKLYFNTNGGTMTASPTKEVYFGSAVGTLPAPTLKGKVFMGWVDANGVEYTATTTYQVAGDTTLTAKWQDEATVLLYIYINGNFASCDRMIAIDGLVKNNNVSRSDVYKEIARHYVPASGYLNIAGLFDGYGWDSYRTNTSKPGVETVQIDDSRINRIYVMVTNALTGSTIVTNPTYPGGIITNIPQNSYWVATGTNTGYWVQGTAPQGSYWVSTGNGNGYWVYPTAGVTPGTIVYPTYIWVGTNPKTGDTSMIEAAAAVMVLAAAALVTVMSLRKKKVAK